MVDHTDHFCKLLGKRDQDVCACASQRSGALGGTRTHTGLGLSELPLPLGYKGAPVQYRATRLHPGRCFLR